MDIVATSGRFADAHNSCVRIQMHKHPISSLGNINDKSFYLDFMIAPELGTHYLMLLGISYLCQDVLAAKVG